MHIRIAYYFFTNKKISKQFFFQQFNVRKNTYAYSIVETLFNSLCADRQSISKLYKKYYQYEFNDIPTYLEAKYGLEQKIGQFFENGYITDLNFDPYKYKVRDMFDLRIDDNSYYSQQVPKLLDTIFGGKYEN